VQNPKINLLQVKLLFQIAELLISGSRS
jgi:hypothetical protein